VFVAADLVGRLHHGGEAVKWCVSCGQSVEPGHALCRRCRGRKALAEDLARPFPVLPMNREEKRQATEAREFDSSVLVRICPHGFDPWNECPACSDAADFDGGWE
jgi:hypothetical protein